MDVYPAEFLSWAVWFVMGLIRQPAFWFVWMVPWTLICGAIGVTKERPVFGALAGFILGPLGLLALIACPPGEASRQQEARRIAQAIVAELTRGSTEARIHDEARTHDAVSAPPAHCPACKTEDPGPTNYCQNCGKQWRDIPTAGPARKITTNDRPRQMTQERLACTATT